MQKSTEKWKNLKKNQPESAFFLYFDCKMK